MHLAQACAASTDSAALTEKASRSQLSEAERAARARASTALDLVRAAEAAGIVQVTRTDGLWAFRALAGSGAGDATASAWGARGDKIARWGNNALGQADLFGDVYGASNLGGRALLDSALEQRPAPWGNQGELWEALVFLYYVQGKRGWIPGMTFPASSSAQATADPRDDQVTWRRASAWRSRGRCQKARLTVDLGETPEALCRFGKGHPYCLFDDQQATYWATSAQAGDDGQDLEHLLRDVCREERRQQLRAMPRGWLVPAHPLIVDGGCEAGRVESYPASNEAVCPSEGAVVTRLYYLQRWLDDLATYPYGRPLRVSPQSNFARTLVYIGNGDDLKQANQSAN